MTSGTVADFRGPGRVIHLAGAVSDEVFGFLAHTSAALGGANIAQTFILADPVCKADLERLHESAHAITVPASRHALAQWQATFAVCRDELRKGSVGALHMHGPLAWLIGASAAQSAGVSPSLFYSPHSPRDPSKIGVALNWLATSLFLPSRSSAIVSMQHDIRSRQRWKSVELIESAAHDAFFEVFRKEARHPLIVTGDHTGNARGANMFAQLAVLLGGEALRVSFNWLGPVNEKSRRRLTAANVGIFDPQSDIGVAEKLAAGWIFVAAGTSEGFPLRIAEAMATGTPCVALASPEHNAVLRHGQTGFLCDSERDMMRWIAALIDDSELRHRVSRTAREEAVLRFSRPQFHERLLSAYSLSEEACAQSAPPPPVLARTVEYSEREQVI